MILADCCFNATHESFNKDLDNVYRDANSVGVEYFFSPTSQESEIETLLSESLKKRKSLHRDRHPSTSCIRA